MGKSISSYNVFFRTLAEVCTVVNTPYSLKVFLLLREGAFLEIVTEEPCQHPDSHPDFARNLSLYSFVKKGKFPGVPVDTKAAALLSAQKAEELCALTNQRFRSRNFELHEEMLLSAVSRKISEILGRPCPSSSIFDMSGWGPGSTAAIPMRDAQIDNKLLEKQLSVTSSALALFNREVCRDVPWLRARGIDVDGPCCLVSSEFLELNHNKMAFVPKTSKTDRSICAEPSGNLFLQKGIGQYIRRRLKRYGVDLDDQSTNQRLCRLARKRGLCTLDLSMASDTVSVELVRDLLPVGWFDLLDSVRSRATKWPDGAVRLNQKFSSMGNGFTFELETLIFYAILCVVDGGAYISAYGDDLICSRLYADDVMKALRLCGFVVNDAKSFVSGDMYESCGVFYLRDRDITPPFQKKDVISDNDVPGLIRMHNRLFRWGQRYGLDLDRALRFIRGVWPYFQPDSVLEDLALLSNKGGWEVKRHPSYQRVFLRIKGYRAVRLERAGVESAVYAYKLRFVDSSQQLHEYDDKKPWASNLVTIRREPKYRKGSFWVDPLSGLSSGS